MSEVSSEAVEAAARALWGPDDLPAEGWDQLRDYQRDEWREWATAALTAALPYLAAEGTQPGCTGAPDCPAPAHVHGCYADTEGHCDDPHDHEDAAHQPARVLPSVEDVGLALYNARRQTEGE